MASKTIKDFPSASAVEYDDGKLYVFGDDAPYLLVMDTDYIRIDTIRYSIDTSYRMAKSEKFDIESATLFTHNNSKHLFALGSLSDSLRKYLFYFPLADLHTYLSIDYSAFAKKLEGLDVNIEGMALVSSKLVLANRANKKNRMNKLIITDNNLYEYKSSSAPVIIDLRFNSENVVGVSGLYYLEDEDMLLLTASEEDTYSATSDGAIQDSYLGWIRNFTWKMDKKSVKPDVWVKLSDVDPKFVKQKVESVCVQESRDKEIIIQLVADNDDGESSFFQVGIRF